MLMSNMLENNELVAVKANKFVQEYRISLSLAEIRIVNYLIANIDSPKYDKEFREFKFDIKEFADIVYPEKNKGSVYQWLPKIIKNLSDKSAWKEIPSDEKPGKMKKVLVRWIEEPEFDVGFVKLKLNKYLAPYLLQLDKGFFKSKFQYTALAQSKYTIPLYELLKSWEAIKNHKKTFEIGELRLYMDALEKSKNNIAEFKRRALDPAVKEINQITDLSVSYKEIKHGRKVTHIEFTILHKPEKINTSSQEQIEGQAEFIDVKSFDDYMAEAEIPPIQEESDSDEDVLTIVRMMKQKDISFSEAKKIYDSAKGDMNQIAKVYEYCKNRQADNFVGLMIKMVKPGEFIEPKKNAKKTGFHNFEERKNNYDDLEKMAKEQMLRRVKKLNNKKEN